MQKKQSLWLFPFALIFLEIAVFLSNDMYLPSMPAIAHDLSFTQEQTQYTLTLWFLGSGSLQLLLGPISDRFGRRSLVVIGGIVYVISSVVCAVATTLPILLIARFIQGSTICAVLVAGGAAVHELFNTKMAIKIFAVINAVTILAPAFGPLVGAIIVQFASWRYIFWLLAIMGTFATISILLYMPESNLVKHRMHFKTIFKDYVKLFCNKEYMLPNIGYCLLISIFFLWMFEAPFLMIETYGFSNLYYGISQTFIFSCFFIGAKGTDWMLDRFTVRKLINTAIIITGAGAVLFAITAKLFDSMWFSIVCMMVISTGASMLFAPLNRIAIEASSVPMGRRLAISSSLVSLFGALAGWLVTLISIHALTSIAAMIVGCIALAVVVLLMTNKTASLIVQ